MHQKNNTIPVRFQTQSKAFYDFWEFEGGLSLLKQLPVKPKVEEAEKFVPYFYKVDKLADAVVAEHCTNPKTFIEDIEQIITWILKPTFEGLSNSVISLKKQITTVPDWVDRDLLNLGCEVCNISGKSGLIILRNYSLMTGYMSAAINKPLIATGALKKGPTKRIGETTEFWVAVTQKNNLQVGNAGFYFALKTRLIHSFSRKMILDHTPWEIDQQGLPLNQWDMLATYLGFSVVFLEGLKKVGFTFTEQEHKATYHLWRYIGYLIGIPDEILPQEHLQAIKSLYLWTRTQPEADEDTIQLARALHMEPLLAKFPPRQFEKKFIQNVNLGFDHFLIGSKSCEILHLPPAPIFKHLIKSVVLVNRADMVVAKRIPVYKKFLTNKGLREQKIIEKSYLKK